MPVTQKLLSLFRSISYGKVVRSVLFLLLVSTCTISIKSNPISASIIALIAFIAFDIVCAAKRPKFIDFTSDIDNLKARNKALEERNANLEVQFKEVKSDLSVAKISTVISGGRR